MTTKRTGNPPGRPTVMTDAVIAKLEHAFSLGCTDLEACFFAGVSKDAFYDYQAKTPGFADRKDALKTNPVLKARKVLVDAVESGDVKTATWLVEKHDGKARQAVAVEGGDKPLEVRFSWAQEDESPGE